MRKWLLIILVCVGCGEPQVGRLPVHWRRAAQKHRKCEVTKLLVKIYVQGQTEQMNFIEARYDANGTEAVEKLILKWKEQKRGKPQ